MLPSAMHIKHLLQPYKTNIESFFLVSMQSLPRGSGGVATGPLGRRLNGVQLDGIVSNRRKKLESSH